MKSVLVSLSFAIVLIAGALMLTQKSGPDSVSDGSNVSMVDGKQVIEITAKGGYSPQTTVAQAGVPTLIQMKTSGTYDCSAAVTIPSVNFSTNLDPTGTTEIELPSQESGTTLQGLCAMGMYNFAIQFE